MAQLLMFYRSLNVLHLLDDELEHELKIRNVDVSSGESRQTKRTKLRYALRKQREDNKFEFQELEEADLEAELNQVDEKLASIRGSLEDRRARKAVMPQLQTRLVHLYYRLSRLKKHRDTEGLEGVCSKLLSDHFGLLAKDSEAGVENSRRSQTNRSRTSSDSSSDEDGDSVEEGDLGDEELEEEEEHPVRKRRKGKKAGGAPEPVREGQQPSQSDELAEILIKKMDRMITKKLNKLCLEKGIGLQPEPEAKKKKRRVEEVEKKQKKKVKRLSHGRKGKQKKPSKGNASESSAEKSGEDTTEEGESDDYSGDEYDESDAENRKKGKYLRRRPRPVSEWKLKYDGKDDGRNLNKFLTEVEFLAKAEGISKHTLFNEAIHLFGGDARAWFMEGRKNREFRNWDEMVADLKLEFQLPDMDFHYEQQASQRRQRRSEKFQDFYNAVKEIFDRMSEPPSEQKMFDIMFRNLRSDYKNSLLVKGVRSLRTLKIWGRKLDSANWFLYRNREGEQASRSAQVNEIGRGPGQGNPQFDRRNWRDRPSSGNQEWKNRSEDKRKFHSKEDTKNQGQKKEYQSKPEVKKDPPKLDNQEGSSNGTLEKRISTYKVPDRTVCFNCRGKYHHFKVCLKEKEVFCSKCGFHDFPTQKCPFCAKNGHRSS